jgi:hypothetical protein
MIPFFFARQLLLMQTFYHFVGVLKTFEATKKPVQASLSPRCFKYRGQFLTSAPGAKFDPQG